VNDPAKRRQLSGQGKSKVIERFGFQTMLARYEAIYTEVAAGHGVIPRLG
jgi:hypothetical protein